MQERNNVIVTSVYKDGGDGTTKEKYTQVWVRIIKGRESAKALIHYDKRTFLPS